MRGFSRFIFVASSGLLWLAVSAAGPAKTPGAASWVRDFPVNPAELASTGQNPYFVLEPGCYHVLKGAVGDLTITVLNETKMVAGVETRVVEERETVHGKLEEVSRNYFAINKTTHDVLYFGEEVDMYTADKVVNHEGSWVAGLKGAKAGLLMPGRVRTGFRHYQELAPGIAMDRAEILSTDATVETPAGKFTHCVKTVETSALAGGEREYKYFAPDIGLIKYEGMLLADYGTAAGSSLGKKEAKP